MKKYNKKNLNLSPLWGRKEFQFENTVRKLENQERVKNKYWLVIYKGNMDYLRRDISAEW